MPAKHNWDETYQNDSEKKLFLDHLSINASLDQSTIRTLPAVYRTAIARNQIGLLSGQLVYYEQITFANKHICRIVVPLSLRRKIFVLIHASPVAGHMGEYKTLYRIRLGFFFASTACRCQGMDSTMSQLYSNTPLATTGSGVDVFLAH